MSIEYASPSRQAIGIDTATARTNGRMFSIC